MGEETEFGLKSRYLDLEDKVEDLRDLMRSQKEVAAVFEKKLVVSLLYHENALEGVVYTPQEIEQAFDGGQSVADITQRTVVEQIRRHRAAFERIQEEARRKKMAFTVKLLEETNSILSGKPHDELSYRREMPLHRTYFHEIAQPPKIAGQLEKLVALAKGLDFREAHPIRQAATLHWHLMQVFPFPEHSGRVARLFCNLSLLHAGYLPVVIHAIDRQRYYESLRLPLGYFLQLLIEAIDNSLQNGFKFFQDAIRSRRARNGLRPTG